MTGAATLAYRVVGEEIGQETRDQILDYLLSSERGAEILGAIWATNTNTTFYWSESGTYASNQDMYLDRHDDVRNLMAGAAHEIYHVQEYVEGRRAWPGQDGYVQKMLLEEAGAHAAAFVIHMQTGERYPAPHNFRDFEGRFRNIVRPGRGREVNYEHVEQAARFYGLQAMSRGSWRTSNTRERYRPYYERAHNEALQAAAGNADQAAQQPYQAWQPTPARTSSAGGRREAATETLSQRDVAAAAGLYRAVEDAPATPLNSTAAANTATSPNFRDVQGRFDATTRHPQTGRKGGAPAR